ncbi:MAG: hypothetical protein JW395_3820 [Nitrospira sp.]|nr:hypothetical protein [Nitrospira sp.]
MIANTLPELRGLKSGICDDVAVGLLKWTSACQPYVSNDIDNQPVWSIWSIQSVSCVWLNETNQINQIDQID